MARILLVCEMGEGLGHVTRLLRVAVALREFGHEPWLVVNDLARAEVAVGGSGVPVLQCPQWMLRVAGLPPMRNYTDIMMRFGFLDRVGLRGLVRSWHEMLALLRPSLLILDHSPVAIFATRDRGVPRLRLGTGFFCPPLQVPMPPMAWWAHEPSPFDEIGERNVVRVANQVSADLALPRSDSVAQLLHTEGESLCTFAELDHYGVRGGAQYEGPILGAGGGTEVEVPQGDADCAFVYLNVEYPHLEPLIRALDRSGFRAIVHVPGLAPMRAASLSSARIRFTANVVPMDQAGRDCKLAITHASFGAAQKLLLHGRPQLMLPRHLEQMMLARRMQELGVGIAIDPGSETPDFGAALRRLRSETKFRQAAEMFAAGHRDHDSRATAARLAARCAAVL